MATPSAPSGRRLAASLGAYLTTAVVFTTVPRFDRPFASTLHRAAHEAVLAVWWGPLCAGVVGLVALEAAHSPAGSRRVARRAWLVPFAVGAGVGSALGGLGVTGDLPGVVDRIGWAVAVGVVTALVATMAGLAVGRCVRWLAHRALHSL